MIREYDDIDEGTLFDLARLELKDPKAAFNELRRLIPENIIKTVLTRANDTASQEELLLLAEEIE
jgi:hypothetical protein